MRAVVQRVKRANVAVDGAIISAIDAGLLVYLGIGKADGPADLAYLVDKVRGLRVFADDAGKMNRGVVDAGGAVLVVSQFTLYGDVRSGRRPGFDGAMTPQEAEPLYERFVAELRSGGLTVATGRFRANMLVESAVDGPITIMLDSSKLF